MDQEQEPLIWMPADQAEMDQLMRQLHRLIVHHNDTHPGREIDQARIEVHLPAFALMLRHQLVGEFEETN